MSNVEEKVVHSDRKPLRVALKGLAKFALNLLTDFKIEGSENFPEEGPLIVVGNHFSFIDPVVFVGFTPYPLEFIGGTQFPHAPAIVKWIPRLWGYLPVYRGTGSTYALKEAEKILKNKGFVGIFPEAGAWARNLRPARPGAAYLSAQTGAKILPVGLSGLPDVFPSLKKFRKADVTIKVGKAFGPFKMSGDRHNKREQLDKFGHEIMKRIAKLIPQNRAGMYSDDPQVREEAKGSEVYPWEGIREGQDKYKYKEKR